MHMSSVPAKQFSAQRVNYALPTLGFYIFIYFNITSWLKRRCTWHTRLQRKTKFCDGNKLYIYIYMCDNAPINHWKPRGLLMPSGLAACSGDHCASIQRPRQHLSHHGNGSAFTLPSLRDLLCHYSSFGRSRKAQGSCCSSYTETELSGFRRPLSVLTIFMVAQRGTKVAALCKGGFSDPWSMDQADPVW